MNQKNLETVNTLNNCSSVTSHHWAVSDIVPITNLKGPHLAILKSPIAKWLGYSLFDIGPIDLSNEHHLLHSIQLSIDLVP